MGVLLAVAFTQALIPTAQPQISQVDPCAAFERESGATSARSQVAAIADLVTIADIGRSNADQSPSAFSVSPDGEQIAFVVRRANPETNSHCQKLIVAPMDGLDNAQEIDRGGEFVRDHFRLRNFPSITAGWSKVITPRWSPSGDRLAFLKRKGGSTQVWVATVKDQGAVWKATALEDNVDDFAWTSTGDALVVSTRPELRLQAEAIADEARDGFLFDDRFSPQFADRPIPTQVPVAQYTRIELATGAAMLADAEDIQLLAPAVPGGIPAKARNYAAGPEGYSAWLEAKPRGLPLKCDAKNCEGVREMWWSASAKALFAVQKTGWAQSQMALLRWDIGDPAPHTVLVSDDVFIGCAPHDQELVCAREGSTRPRRLVAINMKTRAERVLYDPNPGFAGITLGKAKRVRFSNRFGAESYADIIMPPDHRPGEKHPLVVVQYTSHGYLRGGTGDEVPIQLLAARGFVVLSFARPDFLPDALEAKTEAAMRLANRVNWVDRRNVQSSLESAIRLALETGAVDPDRMGISGFSDGGTTVQWALIHSSLFKVASMGSCCEDMYSYPLAAGPAFADFGREMGYRFYEPGAPQFWQPLSLTLNADHVDVPILIQTGDSEYEGGLDVVETFRHRGKPIELYVLEDEGHFKWQPAHRLAIYQRSVEWFEFWLMHKVNCSHAREDQYRRWKAMRGAPDSETLQCTSGTEPIP